NGAGGTSVSVSGNGDYLSANYLTDATGNYKWVASYSGDDNNALVAGVCDAPASEISHVTPKSPTLVTAATDSVVGGNIHDVATLAGGFNPTGTITFNLYPHSYPTRRSSDLNGAGGTSVSVSGNGDYLS